MSTSFKYMFVLEAALMLTAAAGPAQAQIELRYSPPDTTIEPEDTTILSVMLDDAVFIRTFELMVTYDPTLISTVDAGPGALFSDSGFFVWETFAESVPGQWHASAIIMGATDSLSGPGELFAWEVEGLIEGTSPITTVQALLYAPNATIIPDVNLDSTTLRVRNAPSAVGDLPTYQSDLTLYPNPFNPRTRVGFDLPSDGHVRLAVFDARGRRVAVLHEGVTGEGPIHFDWNGQDDKGARQPGGVYLFRLEARIGGITHTASTKGILLK